MRLPCPALWQGKALCVIAASVIIAAASCSRSAVVAEEALNCSSLTRMQIEGSVKMWVAGGICSRGTGRSTVENQGPALICRHDHPVGKEGYHSDPCAIDSTAT